MVVVQNVVDKKNEIYLYRNYILFLRLINEQNRTIYPKS